MTLAHRFAISYTAALLAIVAAVLPFSVFAQTKLNIPEPVGFVNDFADFLKPETETFLEQKLQAFQQETAHEIAVVTTDSLQDTDIEDLAVRWFEEWKIGTAGNDDGILLLIVPSERVLRIEVGYGLEPVVPDSIARQVGDTIITPRFREDDPDGGVVAGVDALMALARGEEVALVAQNPNVERDAQIGLVFFVVMLFVFGWVIYDRFAMVKPLQKTLQKIVPRGVFVGLLSLGGGWIAGLAEFLHPLLWSAIFAGTIGALIFYVTKHAGERRAGPGGRWYTTGSRWTTGGGGGGFGGFGGGSSGGGGSTSRW